MKPGKVLCCSFLLAFLEVDPLQNLVKYKGGYVCSYIKKHCDYAIHA